MLAAVAALAILLGQSACLGGPDEVIPGNQAPAPESMSGFSWVLDYELAGMPKLGARRDLAEDLAYLRAEGIQVLISLTLAGTDPVVAAEYGIEVVHIPVVDFTAPTPLQIRQMVATVDRARADFRAVGVHCTGGMGRTGTMLAAYFVAEGATGSEAIATIREIRPGSIETASQEHAVLNYWESIIKGIDDLGPDERAAELD